MKTVPIEKKFVFYANRATRNFTLAFTPLGGVEVNDRDNLIDFSYFTNTSGFSQINIDPENRIKRVRPTNQYGEIIPMRYKLMERQLTLPLENKRRLASRLREHNICDPMVYFSIREVPRLKRKLWYVKHPVKTGGKEMTVVPYKKLKSVFKPNYIIQEAVSDLFLIDNRKFTIRAYVLAVNKKIFLFPNATVVIHGPQYDPKSTDHEVQINHKKQRRLLLSGLPFHSQVMMKLMIEVPRVFRVFPELRMAPPTDYCLFGVDYLLTSKLELKLIEINDVPNFVHPQDFDNLIIVPMFRSLFYTVKQMKDLNEYKFIEVSL